MDDMYTNEALQILVFLVPGFLSVIIFNKFESRREQNNQLRFIVEALIFSLAIYSFFSIFYSTSPIYLKHEGNTYVVKYESSLGLLVVISLLLPCFISFILTHDWFMALARKLNITTEGSHNWVWQNVFYRCKRSIIVHFADNRRLQGWPEYYSKGYQDRYLYITDPQWIVNTQTGKYQYQKMEEANGLLITPDIKIDFIEFSSQEYDV